MREKFTCRDCEKISQAPAPFHVIPRGWAGPSLLAMIAFEKFGQHQPLNRQAERYAKEGVPLSLSTLANQVGAVCTVMQPIFDRIEAHVFGAERLHGDDTTVPVLAKGKTDIGRCWTYVRDDRPFGGPAPPGGGVLLFRATAAASIRGAISPNGSGVLQADAYGGYDGLYQGGPQSRRHQPGPVLGAWPAQGVRAGGHCAGRPAQGARQDRGRLADRPGGGQAHRTPCSTSSAPSTASLRPSG